MLGTSSTTFGDRGDERARPLSGSIGGVQREHLVGGGDHSGHRRSLLRLVSSSGMSFSRSVTDCTWDPTRRSRDTGAPALVEGIGGEDDRH